MSNIKKFLNYGILTFLLHAGAASANEDFKKGYTHSTKELLAWRAPVSMHSNLRYYQSGIDSKGRPVIIQEGGKWDIASYMAADGESARNVTKYVEQAYMRLSKESNVFDTTNGFFLIIDASGYSLRQLATPGVMALSIRITEMLISVFDQQSSTLVFANMDPGGAALWNIMRWMFGSKVAGMEAYGTDQTIERLLQDIPKTQLPTKYGGYDGFKPVKTFDSEIQEAALPIPGLPKEQTTVSVKQAESLLALLAPGFNNTEPVVKS